MREGKQAPPPPALWQQGPAVRPALLPPPAPPGARPAPAPHPQGPLQSRTALLDRCLVPARTILVLEQDQAALARDTRRPPRVREQHEREQPEDLGLVRHQAQENATEADGLGAQLLADERLPRGRLVALVEDQVEHPQDRINPLREEVVGRDTVRDAGLADLAFRANQPLCE